MSESWKYVVHSTCLLVNLTLLGLLLKWTSRGAPESDIVGSQGLVIFTLWMVLNITSALTALTSLTAIRGEI